MIYIVTALPCESKPLIQYFNLKKDVHSNKFEVYQNKDVKLIISGIGMLKASIATTYLLTYNQQISKGVLLNIGICGTINKTINKHDDVGTPILVHKIVNHDTKKMYYPDILLHHPFKEGSIESFSSPIHHQNNLDISCEFVDMEAAGFMEAAITFLPMHNIHCIKIVSDHLEGHWISPETVKELINQNLPAIHEYITNSCTLANFSKEVLSSEDEQLIHTIGENLKLSATLMHQLKEFAIYYKVKTSKNLNCLTPFLKIDIHSKTEGKMQFETIKKILIQQ